jgi:dipeptide/tripeptide permease
MITYLTQELNMPLVQASNTLTNFGGTASFTPLIGALIADSFAGRFWTIMAGSIIYEIVYITKIHLFYLFIFYVLSTFCNYIFKA